MPKPKPSETRTEYMDRCVPMVIAEGTAETVSQAVAICSSMWEKKEEDSNEH